MVRRISPILFCFLFTLVGWFKGSAHACSAMQLPAKLAGSCMGWFLLAATLTGCSTDYLHLPAFSENKQVQAVILSPAGSIHLQEYDAQEKTFKPAMEAGLAKRIDFLPLPGNLGFIPSTAYRAGDEAEARPLQVLVLAESVPTGTVQEIIPISTLLLDIAGELQPFVIAVPARPSEQALRATDWASFQQQYPAAREILQKWFLHSEPKKNIRLSAWKDEAFTDRLIRKWLL